MEQEFLEKIFKLHHISSRRNSRNKANNNARKHFPDSSHTKSSKKQKYRIRTNNHTIHSKTFCYSSWLKIGLSNN